MGVAYPAGEEAIRLYSAYGLTLESDVAIPGLLEIEAASLPAYRIRFGSVSRPVQEPASPHTGFAVRHDAAACAIRFADGTAAEIDLEKRLITLESIDGASFEDGASYVTGPVVGMLARLEGRACFHGAVVVIDGEAHLLCGPSESGKSTTAAAFAREGFSVMSDDIAAIDASASALRVLPSNPRIQLWPDGAAMVFGPDHNLPEICPPWEKRYLDLVERGRFQGAPTRLGAVWIFTLGTDAVETLSGSKCLTNLVSNAYLPSHATPEMRHREFDVSTEICRTVPVRLLPAQLDPGRRVETIARHRRGMPFRS